MNINRNTSHPSAFISSTFLDLKDERRAVASILKRSNLNINALDIRPASNNKSKSEIVNGIKESDFVILIVGRRYGSIIPEMTGSQTLSITRWEYNQARISGKYVLVFFKEFGNDGFGDDSAYLTKFKNILSRNHNPKYFSSIGDLEDEVSNALIPIYRAGVTSLLSKLDQAKYEIDQLKQANQKLVQDASKSQEPSGILKGLGLTDVRPYPQLGGLGLISSVKMKS